MTVRKMQMALLLMMTLNLGCQPAKDDKPSIQRGGRLARGENGYGQAAPRAGTTGAGPTDPGYGKQWGDVTSQAGDQAFAQELYYMDSPALSGLPEGDQLGNVSSQSGQATGVRFWGNAVTQGGNGVASGGSAVFDRKSMILRLEIYDDKTGQTRADGSLVPNIPIQISADRQGFVDAGGSLQGNQADLYFSDSFGTIYLSGTINGDTFAGTIRYANSATNGQTRILGNFSIATCGFFSCINH